MDVVDDELSTPRAQYESLLARAAALTERFGALGVLLGQASAACQPPWPRPDETLVLELGLLCDNFDRLSQAVAALAEHLGLDHRRDDSQPATLEAVLQLLGSVEALLEHQRLQEFEQVRSSSVAILDRVLALRHQDDAEFAILEECQATARQLRAEILASSPSSPHRSLEGLCTGEHPFAKLVRLIEQPEALDEEALDAHFVVVEVEFGRRLALASVTGRLRSLQPVEGEAQEVLEDVSGMSWREPQPPTEGANQLPEQRDDLVADETHPTVCTSPSLLVDEDDEPLLTDSEELDARISEPSRPDDWPPRDEISADESTPRSDRSIDARDTSPRLGSTETPVSDRANRQAQPLPAPSDQDPQPLDPPARETEAPDTLVPSGMTSTGEATVAPAEFVATQVAQWSLTRETFPFAFLGAQWLVAQDLTPSVRPELYILAHHAFAPASHQPGPDVLDRYVSVLQRELEKADRPIDGNLWAIGAGLVLLQGEPQGFQWFQNPRWLDSAPVVCRRTYEVLVGFWNFVAEPLPAVQRQTGVRQAQAPSPEARDRAAEILQSMLQRRIKFALGVKLLAHLRQELDWLSHALQPQSECPATEVVAWARELEPAQMLDHWVAEVDPGTRVGVISGTRAALLRDLTALRAAILDWEAEAATSADREHMSPQRYALESLQETLGTEFDGWCEGWSSTDAPPLGRPLLEAIRDIVVVPGL